MKKVIIILPIIFVIGIMFMSKKEPLATYRAKRKFNATPEPKGSQRAIPKDSKMFVIQKHDASRLHYDLRLQIGNVLVSWAVPKGPSVNPADKRLAIQTEDHPLEYGHFEGVIPEGNYGAGPVMVWDIGTYDNLKADKPDKKMSMPQCLKEGKIEVFLHGTKLSGAYALIRKKGDEPGPKSIWFLIKMKDEYASARRKPVNTQNKSVLSDRTIKQIEKSGIIYE